MATLDGQHINAYARQAGFSDVSASHPDDPPSIWNFWLGAPGRFNQEDSPSIIATAVAFAESGGDPTIVQKGQPPDKTGWGLWQITPGDPSLLDPSRNAAAAYAKYKAAGNSFSPWTTYRNGVYKNFMHLAPVGQQNDVNLDPGSQILGGDQSHSIAGSIAGGVATGANSFLAPVVSFLADLTDVHLWRSLGWLALGIVLLILGVVIWVRSEFKGGAIVNG